MSKKINKPIVNFTNGTLTKISDDKFNGNHPNGINQGLVLKGNFTKKPTKGERFYFNSEKISYFSTSTVTEELNENGIFKTLYSTYKLEIEE